MTISLLRKHAKTNSSSFWEAPAVFFRGFSNMKRLWKMNKYPAFYSKCDRHPWEGQQGQPGVKNTTVESFEGWKEKEKARKQEETMMNNKPTGLRWVYNIWFYWSGVAVIRWEYTMQGYPLWISKAIIYDKSNELIISGLLFLDKFQIVVFLRQWNTPWERSGIRGAPHRN